MRRSCSRRARARPTRRSSLSSRPSGSRSPSRCSAAALVRSSEIASGRGACSSWTPCGGVAAGALIGLGVVWVLGAMALQLPGQTQLRRAVQRSVVLRAAERDRAAADAPECARANRSVPGAGRTARARPTPPDPRVLSRPGVRAAAPSVVRIVGTACGLGIEGSGWVARPGVVVTAAHVVAGEDDTTVSFDGRHVSGPAIVFDPQNDIAVLRVPGLMLPPLRLVDPRPGTPVAIVGYPENGPLDAVPGRSAAPRPFSPGTHTAARPGARSRAWAGTSATATRAGRRWTRAVRSRRRFRLPPRRPGRYGVPASIVRRDLGAARGPVSTGPCAR